MPGGTEFTEAEVQPQKEPEVLESPEKVTEVREAAEELQKVDDATLAPEAVVERGDYKVSEDLEKEVVAAVEAAPKLETPPAVTLEGAGAEGKVTIAEASEPAAIIDSNDGSSPVGIIDSNDGAGIVEATERIDPVSIIDTNDGAGTIRAEDTVDPAMIIDTNDGSSTVGIIDTNDGTSREANSTWPTPESGARGVATEGENPPPPTDGGDPVSPSHASVQEVSGSDTGKSQIEYDTEMPEAKTAEANISQDGSKPGEYAFQFEIEGDRPEIGEYERADVSTDPVDFGDVSIEADDDTVRLAGVAAEVIAAPEADASAGKATGAVPSRGSGIPIDDGGDTGDGPSPGGLEAGSDETVEEEITGSDQSFTTNRVNSSDELGSINHSITNGEEGISTVTMLEKSDEIEEDSRLDTILSEYETMIAIKEEHINENSEKIKIVNQIADYEKVLGYCETMAKGLGLQLAGESSFSNWYWPVVMIDGKWTIDISTKIYFSREETQDVLSIINEYRFTLTNEIETLQNELDNL